MLYLAIGNKTKTKTYRLTDSQISPNYLVIQTDIKQTNRRSYLPLTTKSKNEMHLAIRNNHKTYRPLEYSVTEYGTTTFYTFSTTTNEHLSSVTELTRESISSTIYETRVSTSATNYATRKSTSKTNYGTSAYSKFQGSNTTTSNIGGTRRTAITTWMINGVSRSQNNVYWWAKKGSWIGTYLISGSAARTGGGTFTYTAINLKTIMGSTRYTSTTGTSYATRASTSATNYATRVSTSATAYKTRSSIFGYSGIYTTTTEAGGEWE